MSNEAPSASSTTAMNAGRFSDPEFDGVDVAVVLPTLNEEQGLLHTLSDLPLEQLARMRTEARPLVVRLLIVDGGSTDRTVEIAEEHGIAVLRQNGRGKGQAIRQALGWLHDRKVRYAVVLDADFTYPGSMIPAVVELLDSGSQLVVGVRQPVKPIGSDRREAVHRAGNGLLNLAASQLSGLPILDLCSGFWGVMVEAVPPLELETSGFEIEAELFTKAYRAGYTVTQIPIPYRERVGAAKLSALRDGARILLTSIRFGRRKLTSSLRRPDVPLLREILSIALIHGPNEMVLVADGSRRKEAERIARRLRNSAVDARVTVTEMDPLNGGALRNGTSLAGDPPVILTLPRKDPVANAPAAVVELPRTSRLIALGDVPIPAVEPGSVAVSELARSAGYRLRVSPGDGGRSTAVRAIFASLFPSSEQRELAFLGANARHSPMSVWEGEPPEFAGSTSETAHGFLSHRFESSPELLVEEGFQ